MRLVSKLTLWFIVTMAALFAVRGWQIVSRDSASFEADMEHDHRVVGRVFAASLAEVWRAEGEAKAAHLVDVANAASIGARFAWLRENAALQSEIPAPDMAAVLHGAEVQRFDPHRLVSLFPVPGADSSVLVVHESLEQHDRYVRSNALHMFISLAIVVLLCGVSAMGLSGWLVGTPVRLLIEKARRVGQGDLTRPLVLRRNDELGALAVELNAMCDALQKANAHATAETEARLQTVEQLRHADRLSTVGKLAAGVAHELGTPLSIVSGHAEMIAKGEVQGPAVIESASIIDRETKRIARIVRSLLEFARRKGPEGESCNVGDAANGCIAMFAPIAEKTRVEIRLESPPAVAALIDRDSLQQILANLLTNAIQAMPSGGTVRMKVGTGTTAPEGSAKPSADYVRLDIADDGNGIAPEVLPHIFEPFFSTKESGDGTGLGLSVVFGIVEDHGGFVSVDSKRGSGTTFSVFLPKEKAP